jgi:protein-S-isoprenylcysteine O-methyltransferase Ste14
LPKSVTLISYPHIQNIGIALAFGVTLTVILTLPTIIHWIVTALKEEEMLSEQFPADYQKYMQQVRWRMVPGIF